MKIWWRGSQLQVTASHSDVTVKVLSGSKNLEIPTHKGILTGEDPLTWNI